MAASSPSTSWDSDAGGIGRNINTNTTTWVVDHPSGKTVSIMVVDSSNPRRSGSIVGVIQDSNDSRCLAAASSSRYPSSSASVSQPPPSATTPGPSWAAKKSSVNVGAIVGGVVGGVFGLALIVGLLLFLLCRRKKRKQATEVVQPFVEKDSMGGGLSPVDRSPPPLSPTTYTGHTLLSQQSGNTTNAGTPISDSSTMDTQDLVARKYQTYASTADLPTSAIVSRKYQDLQSAHTPTDTSPSASLVRGPAPIGTGKALPPSSPTASRPLPDPNASRPSNEVVVEELDAGPVSMPETVPPRYNPEWERQREQ